MIKSKKGSIYTFLLVLLIAVSLISLLIIFASKGKFVDKNELSKQLELLDTYSDAEANLLYVDHAGKHSLSQGIYDLAANAGLEEQQCGEYAGYVLLSTSNGDMCKANSKELMKNLLFYTKDNLKEFEYPFDINIENYEFYGELNNNVVDIYGFYLEQSQIDISPDSENINLYFFKPSFYAFNEWEPGIYNEIYGITDQISKDCIGLVSDELRECILTAFSETNNFHMGGCDSEISELSNDLHEFAQDCLDSKDTDCICKKTFTYNEDSMIEGKYSFFFKKTDSEVYSEKTYLTLEFGFDNLVYAQETASSQPTELAEIEYELEYDKGTLKKAKLKQKDSDEWNNYKEIILLKKENTLAFLKQESGTRECKIEKTTYKTCIKDEKKVLAHDPYDRKLEYKNILYKFAITIPKEVVP